MKKKRTTQRLIILGVVIGILIIGIGTGIFFALSGGNSEDDKDAIRISVTYQGQAFISYHKNEPYTGLNGRKYLKGDLLPVWEEIERRLDIKIKDVTPKTGDAEDVILNAEFASGFKLADIYNGESNQFVNFGMRGHFLPLNEYWDKLPNIKKFIDDNPSVKISLTAYDGNIYYSPYFDGFNEIERMFLLRHDWVEKLLDQDQQYDTEKIIEKHYYPTLPSSLNTTVQGTTKTITKNYAKNIIELQNEGVMNGENLTKTLKDYIASTYGNQYAKPSDLYLSGDAAYDADELIALMRCVKANPTLLTGKKDTDIIVFFPRERSRDTEILALLQLWGVRGVSQTDNSDYLGADGKFHDSVGENHTLDALAIMHSVYKEGLIMKDVTQGLGSIVDYRQHMFDTGHGFMTFDYNATTTMLHLGVQQNPNPEYLASLTGMKFQAVLPPVVDWDDGVENNYIHFSESSRTVKSEGWGIPKSLQNNPEKLDQVLKLLDYPYSEEGRLLVTYGPSAWQDGTYDYFGNQIPKIHNKVNEEIISLAKGNYSNYYRQYVGATLPIGYVKDMGMEYQTLTKEGKDGIDMINLAVESKALVLASADKTEDNKFFQVPPTTYAFSVAERQMLASQVTYNEVWKTNRLYFVQYGFGNQIPNTSNKVLTREEYLQALATKKFNDTYLVYYQSAWDNMQKRAGQE